MRKLISTIGMAALLTTGSAFAQSTAGDHAKAAGGAAKEAGKDTGEAAKEGGKAAGTATAHGAKKAGRATKHGAKKVTHATKKVVKDCGDKAAAAGAAKSEELTAGYLKTLADNGMKVSGPSDQLKGELAEFGKTMSEEWIKAAGPDGKAIIDAYKAM